MKSSAILSLILLYVTVWLGGPCSCSAQTDSIKPGEGLQFSEKLLVSAQGTFTLGFFRLDTRSYLGIWYTSDVNKQKVWVANRDKPISGTNANLMLDANGTLMIIHRGGDPIALNSNQASRKSIATLLDSGNFVVAALNSDGSTKKTLWESFDHPTDTLLPGMKLGINLKTRQNWSLASWINEQVPAPGTSTLEWNGTQLVMKRRGDIYWSSGILKDQSFEFISSLGFETHRNIYYFTSVSNENEIYFSYSVQDRTISKWLLNSRGRFSDTYRTPFVYEDMCGRYDKYPGCAVRQPLTCRTRDYRFMKQSVLNSGYSSLMYIDTGLGLSDCQAICWNNCSCTACNTVFTNGTGCQFWSDKFPRAHDGDATKEELYVLSSSKDTGNHLRTWIIIGGVLVLLAILLILFCLQRKFRGNRERENVQPSQVEAHLITRNGGRENVERLKVRAPVETRSGENVQPPEGRASVRTGDGEKEEHKPASGIAGDGKMGKTSCGRGESSTANRLSDSIDIGKVTKFSFDSVVAATNNFSDENKLGKGGFGPVYKGQLSNGQEIAVKRLSKGLSQGWKEFENEIKSIPLLQHKYVVKLLGYCIKGEENILIYEFMPNKSLDCLIFDEAGKNNLVWQRRYNIIEGIAQGLLYLHQLSGVNIIHRDIKSNNILLDDNMNPKISDFGTARIFKQNASEANTKNPAGTPGYMAPEYFEEGAYSEKTDVYSFGVLLLEIVSGQRSIRVGPNKEVIKLVENAWNLWKEGNSLKLKDSKLMDPCSTTQISKCIHVALWCVQKRADDRPTMSDVCSILTNKTEAPPSLNPPPFCKVSTKNFSDENKRGEGAKAGDGKMGQTSCQRGESSTANRLSDSIDIGKVTKFSFDSVRAATKNFSDENKLGEGGFGPVYKGQLSNGQEIAVKRLSKGLSQGWKEFENEIKSIPLLQHKYIVKLLGYCIKGEENILIYEFMPNKSLDCLIFDEAGKNNLVWQRRYNIIEGIAQGLLYLHQLSGVKIIHRDIKASNILLDDNMNPKISDFGTARIFKQNASEANTKNPAGTLGYMAPEYFEEGAYSEKTDVYSFGVLLLEIVSGQRNIRFDPNNEDIKLVENAWNLWKEGNSLKLKDSKLKDSKLMDPRSTTQISKCIHVALWCVQKRADDRPTMSDVCSILTNKTESPPSLNPPPHCK